MLERIIEWSVANKVIVIVLALFAAAAGVIAVRRTPLEALPDLSDVQVIVQTDYDGQAPQIVEDQVTYPVATEMLKVPGAQTVRGYSFFGVSFVYVIFKDGTDLYWARSRVLEYLNGVRGRLPTAAQATLGPDATGLGWVYQYVLEDTTGTRSLADLRAIQDWYLRYQLTSVPGVSEVASVGGFEKMYEVTVDPVKLRAYNVPVTRIMAALGASNQDAGAMMMELSGREVMVRGLGYLKGIPDIESVVVGSTANGTPIRVVDLATVQLAPDVRRGVADLNGRGDVVGGIVVMRFGQNALATIDGVKARLAQVEKGLPPGVRIRAVYDRSDLIKRAIATLKGKLLEESIVVALVCLVFLFHVQSALVAILTLPLGILMAFIAMRLVGVNADIMSLGGIAIAIGAMIDAAIVMIENMHKHLERAQAALDAGQAQPRGGPGAEQRMGRWGDGVMGGPAAESARVATSRGAPTLEAEDRGERDAAGIVAPSPHPPIAVSAVGRLTLSSAQRWEVVTASAKEVGPALFFSLLIITVSFLPVFSLEAQEGRMFRPLAWTKTLSMAAAALLSVTVVPVAMGLFIRGRVRAERANPISRTLMRAYRPIIDGVLRFRWPIVAGALATIVLSWIPFQRIGSEFMPPLDEGTLLYMPTTLPGIGVAKAREILQRQDSILASFPEVQSVFGKAGRATTATDPAGLDMGETTIALKPQELWPKGVTMDGLTAALDSAVALPGITNAWTMPIKGRIDMLATGIRTPVGIKIFGPDLATLERIGEQVENAIKSVPGTRSVFAERAVSGYYLDIQIDRAAAARHGMSIKDIQDVISTAIGGMTITQTVEGRQRFGVRLRYPQELRDAPEKLAQVLVPMAHEAAGAQGGGAAAMGGGGAQAGSGGSDQIPLGEVATIREVAGPMAVKTEGAFPTAWVYVDVTGRDIGGYVTDAKKMVDEMVRLPAGYTLQWSGQYEYMQHAKEKLTVVVPAVLLIIMLLLYLNFRSVGETLIVLLSLPFALVGGVIIMALLGYNWSVATGIGFIALAGVAAETGVIMLVYLDHAWKARQAGARLPTTRDLYEAIVEGAVERVRPKMMTVTAIIAGLLPIMWGNGTGASVMKRIAAPMVGGMVSSTVLTLVVIPAIYSLWQEARLRHLAGAAVGDVAESRPVPAAGD